MAGFVKLNDVTVWKASYHGPAPRLRGVHILLIEPLKCSLQQSRSFDTFDSTSAAINLSTYLHQVNSGRIIVGVTADEPTTNLARALPALRQLGVDVSDVQYRGAFVFVAEKGSPTKTVLRKTKTDSATYHARLSATITGNGIYASYSLMRIATNDKRKERKGTIAMITTQET